MSSAMIKGKEITAPVEDELRVLEGELAEIFSGKFALVSAIGEHLVSMKGKRVRPILVFLSARLGKPDIDKAIKVAAAIEIIHTATLLHDDSIDRSLLRRGLPTVNRLWNDQVSVIMGDHLFCTAFRLLHETGDFKIATVLSEGSDSMTYGEMFQMDLRGKYDISEETYLDMIGHKTAALFSSACEAGALIGGLDDSATARLKAYGETIGIAFQIVDDILDFVGDVDVTGKPIGNDVRDGRVTLPLLVALRNAGSEEAARLRRLIDTSSLGKTEWKQVVDFIEKHRGIVYSHQAAQRLAQQAKSHIADLKACPARNSLMLLADRVVSRQK
ncbi:MAG: polyprenyl synthetase family protein [Candidatus Eisenbacteria bacterium]